MDTVADAVHAMKLEEAAAAAATGEGITADNVMSQLNPRGIEGGIESLEKEIALTLLPSLLLFGASAAAISLVVYFFINLSDCQEDLINPYTLCERVNSKLHWELIAHSLAVGALVLEELIDGDRLHWLAMVFAMPGLLLRAVWWRTHKLDVDATQVFHPNFASRIKTRWGLMALWHGLTLLFGFVQLVMHMVLGLHTNMPHTMRTIGEHHMKVHHMNHHVMFGH